MLGVNGCATRDKLVRRLDESHAQFCQNFGEAVDRVDRVFGEPRVEDRERIARLKVGAQVERRENHDDSYTVPLSLRLPLPALERRANIFLRLDSIADASGDFHQAGRSLDDNKSLTATILARYGGRIDTGARLELYWNEGLQTGVRPFVRWEAAEEPRRLFLEQQLFYLTDEHFGLRSIVQFDRVLDARSFARFFTTLEVSQETPGVDVEHAVIYRRSVFSDAAVFSAELGAAYNLYSGDPETRERGAAADPDEAYGRLRVIGRVFRPWIEYEFSPATHFPWRHRDKTEYGVTFALRLIFESGLPGATGP